MLLQVCHLHHPLMFLQLFLEVLSRHHSRTHKEELTRTGSAILLPFWLSLLWYTAQETLVIVAIAVLLLMTSKIVMCHILFFSYFLHP